MGFLKGLGKVLKGIGSVATAIIPGTLDDKIFAAVTSGGTKRPAPAAPQLPPNFQLPPSFRLPAPGAPQSFQGLRQAVNTSPAGGIASMVTGQNNLPAVQNGQPGGGAMVTLPNGRQVPIPARYFREAGRIVDDQGKNILERFDESQGLRSAGIPNAVLKPVQEVVRNSCPSGYVMVDPDRDGRPVCMLKEVARKHGFYKSRPKPPISATDYKNLKRAHRTEKKIKKLGQMAGLKVTNR